MATITLIESTDDMGVTWDCAESGISLRWVRFGTGNRWSGYGWRTGPVDVPQNRSFTLPQARAIAYRYFRNHRRPVTPQHSYAHAPTAVLIAPQTQESRSPHTLSLNPVRVPV